MKFTNIMETFSTGYVITARDLTTFRKQRLQYSLAIETKEAFREIVMTSFQNRVIERELESAFNLKKFSLDGLMLICDSKEAARNLLLIPLFLLACNNPNTEVELMISEDTRFNTCVVSHPLYDLDIKWASQLHSIRARRG